MCHQHPVTSVTATPKKRGKRSWLWQGDCWIFLPWTCQVRFIFVKGHFWTRRVKQTLTKCSSTSLVVLFSYLFIKLRRKKNTWGLDFLHLSFACRQDVMRYLYHLKWILWSLSCERKIYSRSSAGRPPKNLNTIMPRSSTWFVAFNKHSLTFTSVQQLPAPGQAGREYSDRNSIIGWRNLDSSRLNNNLNSI